jgi:hypothetical protein
MNIAITAINAGELSPKVETRTDLAKYQSGCRHLENMLVTIYGGAEKRPGSLYIKTAEVPT